MTYPKCADCGNEIFETRVYQCFTCPNEVCANCVEVAGSHDFCRNCAATDYETSTTWRDLINHF